VAKSELKAPCERYPEQCSYSENLKRLDSKMAARGKKQKVSLL
jgi:hypothetical protein